MPNYITNVGVQQVSITIPNGLASATATITAVGSRAFILYGANSASDPQPIRACADITLTNSTTVTADRLGTTGSCIVTCSVVDATPDLVTSVQYGAVTLLATQSSNTAAINAVNANTSALEWLGTMVSDTVTVPTTQMASLSYAATTVTATVTTAVTSTMVVRFCMIEFNPSALQSNVQIFSTAWLNAATSTTQAIAAVTANNTILIHGGQRSDNLTTFLKARQRAVLTNSTTVTINVNTAGSDTNNVYNFTVVEFIAGVLAQPVQRGAITIAGSSATAAITSVSTSKAACFSMGFTTGSATAYDALMCRVTLTNSTTVTGARGSASNSATVSYTVAEFFSSAGSTLPMMHVG